MPIASTFGWGHGVTAGAVALQRTESGLISPFVGTLIDRFGPRKVMAFGITVTGLGFMLLSLVQSLWQFYAVMGLMTVGLSFGTFIVLVTTVGNWFIRQRGRALAILMACSALGGFTLPLLVAAIDEFGWRQIIFLVGVGFWVIGFPAALMMRRRPEDHGQVPDGGAAGSEPADSGRQARPVREVNITLRQMLRTRFFWQLALATSLGQLISSTNLLHLPALINFGVEPVLAAFVVGSVAFGDLVGRLGIGFVGDRADKRYLLGASFAILTIGTLALGLVNAEILGFSLGAAVPLPVFALCFGFGFGASIPLRLAMLADYFGRRSYGSVVGVTSSIGAVFGAVGPVFGGLMFDLTGTYRIAFLVLAVLMFTAVPATLLLEDAARVAAKVRRASHRAGA